MVSGWKLLGAGWIGFVCLWAGEVKEGGAASAPAFRGALSRSELLAAPSPFRQEADRMALPPTLRARWGAIRHPFTLVAVFGAWCSDSRAYLPGLLALDRDPNPFVEVQYLGVLRDKQLEPEAWPLGCTPQEVARVPSFFLFTPKPGQGMVCVGRIIEHPPKANQTMEEALVAMLETAARNP